MGEKRHIKDVKKKKQTTAEKSVKMPERAPTVPLYEKPKKYK